MLELVQEKLLPGTVVLSLSPLDPVTVSGVPEPWALLGAGNYAAVFVHPEYDRYAVKIYAPGRPGIEEEQQVYGRLGRHPAYSECYCAGESFLILRRLQGVTFYECLRLGITLTDQAVADIDEGLAYARTRGLRPHDIHAKNVMLSEGRGLVVDVSDFLKEEDCGMWEDFKRFYYRLYRPIARRTVTRVPGPLLEAVRKGYQLWRKLRFRSRSQT